MNELRLSPKRQRFVWEYVKDFNATGAARRAGYKHPQTYGPYLANLEIIKEAVRVVLEEKCMSADEVLMRLADQARADISEFLQDYGGIDWEAVKDKGHLISEIAHEKGKNSKIKLYSSQSALQLLGKHHGLFVERQEISGKDGEPIGLVILPAKGSDDG